MGIDQIMQNLETLNASAPAVKPVKKKKAADLPAVPAFDVAAVVHGTVERMVEVFGLAEKGLTADMLVTAMTNYDGPQYTGRVQ